MPKISDFILVRNVLEIVCHDFDCDFVDCEILFNNQNDEWTFENGYIMCPSYKVPNQFLAKTFYMLVETYLKFLPQINNKKISHDDAGHILAYVFALTNAFVMKEGYNPESNRDDRIGMKLHQHPFVWVLMKDIICPSRSAELRNLRIVAAHSHMIDAVAWVTEIESSDAKPDNFPFLFLNLDVESESIRSAYLLHQSILAHFPEEDPGNIIKSLFVDHFLKDDIIGFIRMAFVKDEDVVNFFATLSLLTQMEEMEIMATAYSKGKIVKVAQNMLQGPWWFQGLIEKMLQPMRGPEWSVTKSWKTVTDELWNRVEKERKRRGLAEVPFEMLLRITSDHLKTNDKKTLQGLLGDARIW